MELDDILKIGGLVLGTAAVGAAGYWAYESINEMKETQRSSLDVLQAQLDEVKKLARALPQNTDDPFAKAIGESMVQEIEEGVKEIQETVAAYKQSTQENMSVSADPPVVAEATA
jgi:CHASE3 domain sensor protein